MDEASHKASPLRRGILQQEDTRSNHGASSPRQWCRKLSDQRLEQVKRCGQGRDGCAESEVSPHRAFLRSASWQTRRLPGIGERPTFCPRCGRRPLSVLACLWWRSFLLRCGRRRGPSLGSWGSWGPLLGCCGRSCGPNAFTDLGRQTGSQRSKRLQIQLLRCGCKAGCKVSARFRGFGFRFPNSPKRQPKQEDDCGSTEADSGSHPPSSSSVVVADRSVDKIPEGSLPDRPLRDP